MVSLSVSGCTTPFCYTRGIFSFGFSGCGVRMYEKTISQYPNLKHVVSGSQSHCCRWSRTGCMATILTAAFSVRVSSCSWNRVAKLTFVQHIRFKFVKQFCKTDDFACGICRCVSVPVPDFWDRSVCVRPGGLQSFSIMC